MKSQETYALRGVLHAAGIAGDAACIRNRYWPDSPEYDDLRTPWLSVSTKHGVIIIGWRKNVIVIDWSGSGIAAHGRVVVDKPATTHGGRMCHAWGYEEAERCLSRLWALTPDSTPGMTEHEFAAEMTEQADESSMLSSDVQAMPVGDRERAVRELLRARPLTPEVLAEIEREAVKDGHLGLEQPLAIPPRYEVDERSGIVAVIDTHHGDYANRNPGLHSDSDYVVASWSGSFNGNHWALPAAHALCRTLNDAKALSKPGDGKWQSGSPPDDGSIPPPSPGALAYPLPEGWTWVTIDEDGTECAFDGSSSVWIDEGEICTDVDDTASVPVVLAVLHRAGLLRESESDRRDLRAMAAIMEHGWSFTFADFDGESRGHRWAIWETVEDGLGAPLGLGETLTEAALAALTDTEAE